MTQPVDEAALNGDPCLVAEGIHAGYGESTILAGVDLELRKGEVVTVLGPNGAGKSTLIRVLAGTLTPRRGRVSLFGMDLGVLTRTQIARRMAVVPQETEVAFGFRVREVIMMGRAPHQSRLLIPRSQDHAAVDAAISACDLDHLIDRPMVELSGGERRRVSIARALAQQPEVLLMDEPAAHLDLAHAASLYELVEREVRQRGVGCLVVMHDLAQAARWADRVVLLAKGAVRAQGPMEEVLEAGLLEATFGVGVFVGVDEASGDRYFLPRSPTGSRRR